MFTPITQLNRNLSIETPLAFDTLLLDSFTGDEGISRPFRFDARMLADTAFQKHHLVKPEDLIGHEMKIAIHRQDGTKRFVHTICRSFLVEQTDERFASYRAELVPWFSLLSLSSDCRFFQEKTVEDIVSAVFADLGYQDFRFQLDRTLTKWDYCCQYRETDFNFVSRLLEAEGLYYYFEHTNEKCVMVITNTLSYNDLPLMPTIRHGAQGLLEQDDEDHVRSFERKFDLLSAKWTMRDFHFEMPRSSLEVEAPALHASNSNKHLELFDYPGEYAQKFNEPSSRLDKVRPEGETLSKLRMLGDEVGYEVIHGTSNVRVLMAGYKISIADPKNPNGGGKYLLTSVQHSAAQTPAYVSDQHLDAFYDNKFTCIPAETLFTPPRITPKPVIQGPHTAFVVDEAVLKETDPPKEEIWPDKFLRIRVRFPWDRIGKFACWVRVAQPWAGRGWGHQWLPRTGDEVLVDFIEGDPDNPVVIGSVYNTDNMPPFKLPDYKTQSGIATRSTRDGTPKMFNMLRFDDKKDAEQVFIRSQKRGDIRILGSMYETIHGNRNLIVGFPDGTEKGGALNITVGGTNDNHVEGARHTNIDGSETLVVKGDVMHDFQANYTCLVGTKLQLNSPDIVIEASNKIGLTVGGNSIVIDKAGVQIVGMQVKINSGGAGPFVEAPDIEDALDAAESDNGEPGYLQRPRPGGGGGRKKRKANVHHAISKPVTRRPDGKLQVGNHIIIDGDKDFEEKALRDLSRMDTTPTGKDRIDRIDNSAHDTTISRGASNVTNYNTPADAAAPGKPALDGSTGTGNGTGSTIQYNPDREPPTAANPNVNRPSDVALNHEMSHAVHGAEGTDDNSPDPANPKNPTIEETQTINEDNQYRRERGIPPRADHTVL